ncbi:xanthine dehydrogenase subunit XdhB [Dorea sp. D27]|uniref:xanthine dehydrogenase subunit XdhB n=1 Tax=Dorea sp. D27 TaxID=658665 RepID=UPI000673909B|nr:xanthine dehydrogenase subunit XdhB [Dorea sp. D27]KMZ53500.1 xanthine dehydrogenase FAD-binding subunit [Dorea sp. D27]
MYDLKALYEAESVSHAIRLLEEHPDAKVIAGGSDILIKIREGKLKEPELVSIYGLDELRGVMLEEDGTLRIGSLTSFSHVTKNPLIQRHMHVLGEAVDKVGGPQIRNIGTIGGNTCNGVTSADSASTLFAYDALVELAGPDGVRVVPIQDFYLKAGCVDLRHGEIETAVLIPKASYEGYAGHYIKYAMRNAMDIATLGCSVNVKLSEDKECLEDVRIAFGVAGPVPLRCPAAERAAKGKKAEDETYRQFAAEVLKDIRPRESWRASKAFREHISQVLARRAMEEAVNRAGGEKR